eukprot:8009735-Pyramimonas_sp.AAC.1
MPVRRAFASCRPAWGMRNHEAINFVQDAPHSNSPHAALVLRPEESNRRQRCDESRLRPLFIFLMGEAGGHAGT